MSAIGKTSSRCDQIIALIDRCLAEYEQATPTAMFVNSGLPGGAEALPRSASGRVRRTPAFS